jgi:hypothetical protein
VSVLLVVLGGCTYTLPKYLAPTVRETSTAGQASCNTVPPKGASEAAKAYAAAVNAATPAWTAVDATIASEGNITHRNDLLSQVNADAPFLTALRAINFPPKAAPAAKDLIAAIQAYDDFLMTSYNNNGYMAKHVADDTNLNNNRAMSSSLLRDALGLPAAACSYRRP